MITESSRRCIRLSIAVLLSQVCVASVSAGMPALLPSNWTADKETPEWVLSDGSPSEGATAVRIQTISFFVAVLFVSGLLVKALWNSVRRDFPKLPFLTFGRAMGLVGLWGLSFVIVLTMISGARELMTPGAWQKQGWTYQLAGSTGQDATAARDVRQRQLEQLRTALWQFAATHEGRLPTAEEQTIDASLWQMPNWAGLKYLTVPDRRAESTGRLYVFEPAVSDEDRLVLLTNGFVGTMSTEMIQQSLTEAEAHEARVEEGAP